MTTNNTFAGKLTAAASAFFISLVLIAGTVSTPQAAQAQTSNIKTTTVVIGDAM